MSHDPSAWWQVVFALNVRQSMFKWRISGFVILLVVVITNEWAPTGAFAEPAALRKNELASPTRISGVVLDLAGRGIANVSLKAIVRADAKIPDSETTEDLPSDWVVTNANGEFNFDLALDENQLVGFSIDAEGFETKWTDLIPVGTTKFRIVLKSIAEAAEEEGKPVETISGQVFDRVTKKPIVGALVGLQVIVFDAISGVYTKKFDPFVATATTDKDGQYRLEVPSEVATQNPMVSIWASGKGYQPSRENSVSDLLRFRQTGFDSPIRLTPCDGCTIYLADHAGNPLVNALVKIPSQKLHTSYSFLTPVDWVDQVSGTTDEEGFVVLANVIPEAISEVEIRVPGHDAVIWLDRSLFLNVHPEPDAPHYEWLLPETGQLQGQITARGEVVPDHLFVEISTEAKMQDVPEVGIHSVARVPVEKDGSFQVNSLAAGPVFIKPFLPLNQPLRAEIPAKMQVFAGKVTEIEIPISKGVHVHGRIIQSDTRKGHPDVEFQMIYGASARPPFNLDSLFELKTDREGRFEAWVPPGPTDLRLNWASDDYSSQEWWTDHAQTNGDGIEISAGDEFQLETIEVVPTKTVSGKVIGADGKPLAGCTIFGFPDIPDKPAWRIMNCVAGVTIDVEGRFDGRYPSTYPPSFWKVSRRRWPTPTEFVDEKWYAEIVTEDPLVLKVDTNAPPLEPFE